MTARFAKIPEAFLRDTRLTLRDHKVYAALRLFADGNGKACFPSRERIAEAAGFKVKMTALAAIRRPDLLHYAYVLEPVRPRD